MAYRDDLGTLLQSERARERALAKARRDARITALRQVLLAFAFGLSWSVLDDPPARSAPGAATYEPSTYGYVEIQPLTNETFVVDGHVHGRVAMRLALAPGVHRIRFTRRDGAFECWAVEVAPGRTSRLFDGWQLPSCP